MTSPNSTARPRAMIAIAALLGAAASTSTLAAPAPSANPADATPIAGTGVYRSFHEKAGIQRIMDDFIVRITHDPRIERRFKDANLARLKLLLVEQVCYLTGGPCEYGGKDMKSAHAAMGLHNDDFNALAEDLQKSMDKEHVPFAAQNRLLAKLAPMQRVIVTK
jgi:hemoglobin